MLNEDYCSFEVAKLLKEKGFDIPLNYFYNSDGRRGYATSHNWNLTTGDFPDYSCPTHQMAMAWLRETRDIVISIFPTIETDMIVREDYNYAIYKNKTVVYQSCSTSYEEACEAAIRCCLENLI